MTGLSESTVKRARSNLRSLGILCWENQSGKSARYRLELDALCEESGTGHDDPGYGDPVHDDPGHGDMETQASMTRRQVHGEPLTYQEHAIERAGNEPLGITVNRLALKHDKHPLWFEFSDRAYAEEIPPDWEAFIAERGSE